MNQHPLALLLPMIVVGVIAFGCGRSEVAPDKRAKQIESIKKQITSLHQPMGKIQSGDWLESHREKGQTFRQYRISLPVKLTKKRNVLYVLPVGDFDKKQREIVKRSAEFLAIYFNCQVKTLETVGLDVIPDEARRVHPRWGVRQILSTYVLNQVLKPQLPDDAVAMIALTSSDLWPGEDWNFVFGQASIRERVGVWSIFRNGDPNAGDSEFRTCLLRTLKTAAHETGHMFSIQHCIAFECNMCGSNSQEESDRRPVHACPECVSKIWWATGADPVERYQKLKAFCDEVGLKNESKFFQRSIDAIQSK